MPGSYNLGVLGTGQSYQMGIAAGQRVGFQTDDAYNPIAAAPVRAVGPRPIPIVAGGVALDASASDTPGGMYGTSPWNLKSSMLPWLLVALVAGVLWLHYVHFS